MKTVVATSGYFNPLHVGHVRMLEDAKRLGDILIVIVNNDRQVGLKGSVPFMSEGERIEIVRALKCVDQVVLSKDRDGTVKKTLIELAPDIFAKGGDSEPMNTPEIDTCRVLGICVFFGVGGPKIQSSSELIKNILP